MSQSAQAWKNPETGPVADHVDGRVAVALGALDTALDLIEGAVFIADRAGEILLANALGARILERDGSVVRASLADIAATGSARDPWKVVPLPGRGACLGYLVVLSSPPAKPNQNALSEVTRRWNLTARQREVLSLVALGLTNADVSGLLGIEVCTVEFHLSAIFDKAGVDNRTTLIARLHDF